MFIVAGVVDFYLRIKKIIRWLPILWQDYEWDYIYLLIIMKFKLKYMKEYFKDSGIASDKEICCEQIEQAEKLIDRIIDGDDTYLIKALEEIQPDEDIGAIERAHFEKDFNELCDILRRHMRTWWD